MFVCPDGCTCLCCQLREPASSYPSSRQMSLPLGDGNSRTEIAVDGRRVRHDHVEADEHTARAHRFGNRGGRRSR